MNVQDLAQYAINTGEYHENSNIDNSVTIIIMFII